MRNTEYKWNNYNKIMKEGYKFKENKSLLN